jgi:hypothetical protein
MSCAVKVRAPTNRHSTVSLVPGREGRQVWSRRPACEVIPELAAGQYTKDAAKGSHFLKRIFLQVALALCFTLY